MGDSQAGAVLMTPVLVTRVLVIRHAPSVWNVEGRWQGWADPPLAETGAAEAEAAAAALGLVELVITSDLERARRTGAILAPGAPQQIEPLLRELDVGEWSGLTRAELERAWPEELARFDSDERYTPPGGERREAFDVRVGAAARRVADAITSASAQRTLIVCHAGVIRSLARQQDHPDRHIGHLCGFEGAVTGGTLALLRAIDLRPGRQPGDRVSSGEIL